MTCVLIGLSRSLLARIQALMSLTHAVNLSIAMAVPLKEMLIYTYHQHTDVDAYHAVRPLVLGRSRVSM